MNNLPAAAMELGTSNRIPVTMQGKAVTAIHALDEEADWFRSFNLPDPPNNLEYAFPKILLI